ncbi:MAG TPA: hypothetical protein VGL54_03415 [Solirubrobacteraceae bacterium]|jgi:hypothetical protein
MSSKLLPIYLNDHLAGATAGADLARRLAGSNEDEEDYGLPLSQVAREIEEDREALRTIMSRLGVGTDRAKQLLAWAAEKAGRLKLNGRLVSYSPLSRLEELEMLALGVTGKRTLWLSLLLLVPHEESLSTPELETLIGRAQEQLDTIETCRQRAILDAFPSRP